MRNAARKSATPDPPELIFSTTYRNLPLFFWYAFVPFLLLVSAVFFVQAAWFGEAIPLKDIKVPPNVIMFVVCPLIWLGCCVLVAVEVYCRRNPQFITVTTWGVRLPKGRFTSKIVSIAWEDLEGDLKGQNLMGWHIYELTCADLRNDTVVVVNSMLFRHFHDFATLALILGKYMGQDWAIKGFWPGTIRGELPTHPFLDRDAG